MNTVNIPEINTEKDLVSYSTGLSNLFRQFYEYDYRKIHGQFFTPGEVACYMSSLMNLDRNEIRILDPGSGTGILIAAICKRILTECEKPITLTVDCYENDPSLLPLLKRMLQSCNMLLNEKSHTFKYNIYEQDFILHNVKYLDKSLMAPWERNELIYYDIIVSNPPYYKLNKNSPQSIAMKCQDYEQTNIYASFMALSVKMLQKGGEMVFITPRSFCSGFYYQKFRKWFTNTMSIKQLHLFESRKDVFVEDGILQENIIFKVIKTKQKKDDKIKITCSKGKSFNELTLIETSQKSVLYSHKNDVIIRLPTSNMDIDILNELDKWPFTLQDFGLSVSTGAVVPFRTKENLCDCSINPEVAPLLWMHNLQGFEVRWPIDNKKKERCIKVNADTKKILLPVQNYVLLKRFSSKEQKRRIYASVLNKSDFDNHKHIGIENHLNCIYRVNSELTDEESYGFAALLNSSLVDQYFRSLNGHTQVNAADIKNLRLPDINTIESIGKRVKDNMPQTDSELDILVANVLQIEIFP
jgi:adenine-specific DNA-methyltransferase